jgi:hypothetical protein
VREIFSNSLDYSVGLVGSVVISGTSPVTGVFQGFSVNNNAIISAALDENGNNVVSQFGGQTLKRGLYWGLPKGKYFTSITLSSGSLIAYGVRTTSPFDADAQAFFNRVATAGGTLSTTQQAAIDTIVIQMKADGIWSKMKAVYPMVGASAASCAQNLMSSDFTGTFSSGWAISEQGVEGNGASTYMLTGLNTRNNLAVNDFHISIYTRTDAPASSGVLMGNSDNNTTYLPIIQLYPRFTNGNLLVDLSDFNNRISVTNTVTKGFYIATRTSASMAKVFKNRNLFGSNTSTQTQAYLPNTNIPIGAFFDSISHGNSAAYQISFASIGEGLSDLEAEKFYDAVQAFQTTLTRQVV